MGAGAWDCPGRGACRPRAAAGLVWGRGVAPCGFSRPPWSSAGGGVAMIWCDVVGRFWGVVQG
eukprot:4669546-Pyramimonas_sp.AAC.1